MKKPAVTVCIPTYNQARYLRLAVDSALAQTGCEVTVWVSDDCSPDETPQTMAEFAGDPRVHYHRWEKNRGVASNASWVVAQATTEFVVRLDSDDLLKPDYCITLMELLEAHPRAAVAHGGVEEIDQHGAHRRLRLLKRTTGYQSPEEALREGVWGYRVAANICMFRREALKGMEIYRSTVNFVEDWDLFVRLAAAGWGNVYCEALLSSYRVWSDVRGHIKGRKLTELKGIRRLYEESLTPAFAARGWDTAVLVAAKKSWARGQARALNIVPKDNPEYEEIIEELRRLGDSTGLRFRLKLIGCGAGGWLDRYAAMTVKAKDCVKVILRKTTGRG